MQIKMTRDHDRFKAGEVITHHDVVAEAWVRRGLATKDLTPLAVANPVQVAKPIPKPEPIEEPKPEPAAVKVEEPQPEEPKPEPVKHSHDEHKKKK